MNKTVFYRKTTRQVRLGIIKTNSAVINGIIAQFHPSYTNWALLIGERILYKYYKIGHGRHLFFFFFFKSCPFLEHKV